MPRSSHKQKKNHKSQHLASAPRNDGVVRIIGGQLRGRKLNVADIPGLRPTTDRIRETLFNWLQFEVADTRCLDLFAGSGALAFEALSRGAQWVTLVEKDGPAARILSQHAEQLSAVAMGTASVVRADAIHVLQQGTDQCYDIVFIDPPFGMGLAEQAIQLLATHGWLNPGAWVYVETEAELAPDVPAHWQLYREKLAGQVAYRLYLVR